MKFLDVLILLSPLGAMAGPTQLPRSAACQTDFANGKISLQVGVSCFLSQSSIKLANHATKLESGGYRDAQAVVDAGLTDADLSSLGLTEASDRRAVLQIIAAASDGFDWAMSRELALAVKLGHVPGVSALLSGATERSSLR